MFGLKNDQGEKLNHKGIKEAFSKVKIELEDHLDTINENTNEIQANYNYVCELDMKIEKLNEKMDQILMLLEDKKEKVKPKKIKLNLREQEVFLFLYTANDDLKITYPFIARRLGFTEDLVHDYIKSMIKKGIPLLKRYQENKTYIQLDPKFKNQQAKFNIVDINASLRKEIIESLK